MSECKITQRVSLREAVASDSDAVFVINAEAGVRANAISVSEIDRHQHQAWFESKLAISSSVVLIAENSSDVVGVLRFDRSSDGEEVITIAIAPEQRGTGLGSDLIRRACSMRLAAGSSSLVAMIRPGNHASIRAFVKAGFEYAATMSVQGTVVDRYVLGAKR